MSEIYCGNNALSPQLERGVNLGTKYQCLQKGIGSGLNQPLDPTYRGPYRSIDQRRMYCGKSDFLPEGYDMEGNLPQCLQKGVGIGKRQRASRFPRSNFILPKSNRKFIPIIIFIILAILLLITLYLSKPTFLSTKDEKGVKHLDKTKFLITYSILCTILCFVVFLVWIKFFM